MVHQQESFLSFSSWQSLHMATRSTLKPHGPLSSPCQSCKIFSLLPKTLWPSSTTMEPRGLFFTSEPPGLFLPMAAGPRFKSQHQSSSAAPFLTSPTISYTCQHPRILPALLGCQSKSGQVWPHGMEPIFSRLSRRLCSQGSCFPVTSWVEVTPIPLAQSMATAT